MGPLQGHRNSVQSTAFLLDGKQIIPGSSEVTVQVKDATICGSKVGISSIPGNPLLFANQCGYCQGFDSNLSAFHR